ncbi:MAG: DUF4845 domain-containing protein, partial [Sulfurimicrobium sp.]|nr:DUF4845 domain-containing protein [Sulfurimicrobium sp.]
WSVQKIIGVMAKDSGLPEMTTAQVRASFDKRAVVDNVNVISGKDLEISKERGQLVVAANYSVTVPIVGNLSALIAFQATTQGTKAAKMVGE